MLSGRKALLAIALVATVLGGAGVARGTPTSSTISVALRTSITRTPILYRIGAILTGPFSYGQRHDRHNRNGDC